MEDDQLFQSLLHNTTASAVAVTCNKDDDNLEIFSSNSNVILRPCTIFFIGIISLWANSEASRGFEITIINDIKDSAASNRFTLLYVSNDKATRIIQNSSSFVQNILYPNHNYTKKKIEHVTLRLTAAAATNFNEFVINLSPSQIMGDPRKLDYLVKSMVLQGIARVWLWDGGEARAPPWLLDGLVEYIQRVAGNDGDGLKLLEFGDFCLGDKDPRSVAQFLEYCEGIRKGFIQRLNQGLNDGWDDQTVENALGMPVKNVCNSFSDSSKSNGFSSI